MTKLSPSTGPEKYEWSEDDKARLVKAMETIFPKDAEMITIQDRLRHPHSAVAFERAAKEAADRIDALEAQVAALTKDAERLDHIQVTGSTVELVSFGQKPVQHSFRVGGLCKAINFDLRLAIDAAMKESK